MIAAGLFSNPADSATIQPMAAIDIIRRRLKEDRVPDIPDEFGEKKKRPREIAFMDVNLCFAPSVMLTCSQVHSVSTDAGCGQG